MFNTDNPEDSGDIDYEYDDNAAGSDVLPQLLQSPRTCFRIAKRSSASACS